VDAAESESAGVDYQRTLRFVRWYDALLQAHRAIASAVAEENLRVAVPVAGRTPHDDPQLTAAVASAHRLLLVHPVAAKSAFSALVAQGRRYARSESGQELRNKLARSPQVRKASLLWRSLSQGMLCEHEPGELPETYLDNLLRLVELPDLVAVLGQIARDQGHEP
jgi:hypothetical protein